MFESVLSRAQMTPPAIIAEAFDEQALKREWDEACGDEQDATERKVAVLQKALKRWPKTPQLRGGVQHSPEMRRFVRDVLGMPDNPDGKMNSQASRLLNRGMEGARAHNKAVAVHRSRAFQIRRAVVELTTKYQLGADPAACMDALVEMLKEPK